MPNDIVNGTTRAQVVDDARWAVAQAEAILDDNAKWIHHDGSHGMSTYKTTPEAIASLAGSMIVALRVTEASAES